APIPRAHRLARVREADRGDGLTRVLRGGRDLGQRGERGREDVVGVVLDPTRLWEMLRELAVGHGAGAAVGVDRERAHTGGAGVEREDDGHVSPWPATRMR